jgi:hypothetical protein
MTSLIYTKEETDLIIQGLDDRLKKTEDRVTVAEAEIVKLKTIPTPTPTPTPTTNVYDDFAYTHTFTSGGKSPNGKWTCDFFGKGFAKTDGNGLVISPASTTLDMYGGSAQVRSTQQWGNCFFEIDMTTEKRTVTQNPAQWMCAWLLFRHLDKWRHYYLYIGTDRMEFGKKDAPTNITDQATIETYQRHLWVGGPASPIGTKVKIGVETIGDRFKIFYNGALVMDKTDVSSFKSGSISCYSEGAQSRYQLVRVTPK